MTTKIRALVVDDESVARRRIRRLLTADPEVTIVGECADGVAAIETIAREQPDLLFLDVQMPECDGFAVVRALDPAHLPGIVFVTAFDRYALQAFEVHAIDYLLKPYTAERFRTAAERAKERLQRRSVDASLASFARMLGERPRYLSRLSVRSGGRIVLVDLASVDWIEAEDNYVRLHAGAHSHLHRDSLTALEAQLDPERFVRIHRSAILQIDRIAEIHPATHGDMDIVLRTGKVLPLSRTFRDRVLSAPRPGT
jgi:two-component system, LytTR family, response regulator